MSPLNILARAAVPALFLAAVACGPDYERTQLSAIVPDDLSSGTTALTVDHLQVHEGMIVKSHIVLWDDDNVQMPLTIRVVHPEVLEVATVISDRDFAFIGKAVGRTQILLVADGDVVDTIEAEVVPQPELP